jgi:NADH:ubiquinone oxidoreductase subunit E
LKAEVKPEKQKIKSILARYQNDAGMLVPILQDVQAEYNYLPKEALVQVGEGLEVPLSQVYSVGTLLMSAWAPPATSGGRSGSLMRLSGSWA